MTDLKTLTPQQLIAELESTPGSQLLFEHEMTLKTTPGKRTLAGEYQRVPKAFCELFLYSYRHIRNDEARLLYEAKGASYRQQIENQMSNAHSEILKLTRKWENLLQDLNHPINSNYTNPSTIKFEVKTPQEHEFWLIVASMDHLLVVMDNLWQARELDMVTKQTVTTKIVSQVTSIGVISERLSRALGSLRSSIFAHENKADAGSNKPDEESEPSKDK